MKPYTVVLVYINSDASLCETFIECAHVDGRLSQRRRREEAVRQVTKMCAKVNKWSYKQASEETCDAVVFAGDLMPE
jgi:hypothetical protein